MSAAPGGVLALDLSGMVGWAYGGLDERDPIFGCWKLVQVGGEGSRYASFENALADAIATLQPARLVLEAAMTLQALAQVSTFKVVCQQLTLRGIGYSEAYRASIQISEIDAYTARLAVLGTGRFPKDRVKREVVKYCFARGWRVPDHNSGDACIVWQWHKQAVSAGRPLPHNVLAGHLA